MSRIRERRTLRPSAPRATPMQTADPELLTVRSPLVQPSSGLAVLSGTPWAGIAAAWLAELNTGEGRTPRTAMEYGRYLRLFVEQLAERDRPLEAVTEADVQAFAYARLPHSRTGKPGKAPSAAGVSVRLAALRSFYDFARRMKAVPVNPTTDVKRQSLPQPMPRGLSESQVIALLDTIPDTVSGTRDRAIITLAVLSGLRRAELLSLTRESISFEEDGRPVLTWQAKGGIDRRRDLPQPALDEIRASLDRAGRPFEQLAPAERLFPVTAATFSANLRRYGCRIGVADLHAHALRHSAAKLRRQSGSSIEDVQEALGHASIATTARYLARLHGERDNGWQGVARLIGKG